MSMAAVECTLEGNARCTSMGTPWAGSWPRPWGRMVEAEEARLGHRICGSRTVQGKPCTVESSHPTGRCRFHGGFDLTGAPEGNRNATRHGLYARSIRRCGPECPLWKHCPMAGPDIEALAERDRPECPYEVEQYELAVGDGLERFGMAPDGGFESGEENAEQKPAARGEGLLRTTIHTVAMLQVMMLRATSALSVTPLVRIEAARGKSQGERAKIDPALEAFQRLSGEHRRYIAYLRDPEGMRPPYRMDQGGDGQTPYSPPPKTLRLIDGRWTWVELEEETGGVAGGRGPVAGSKDVGEESEGGEAAVSNCDAAHREESAPPEGDTILPESGGAPPCEAAAGGVLATEITEPRRGEGESSTADDADGRR